MVSLLYQTAMFVGSLWCHQLPARSPHLFGAQTPLCWRCGGILLGAIALLGYLVAARKLPRLTTSIVLSLPLVLDLSYNVITGGEGDNARRFVTGTLWGVFATSAALRLLARVHEKLFSAPAKRKVTVAGTH